MPGAEICKSTQTRVTASSQGWSYGSKEHSTAAGLGESCLFPLNSPGSKLPLEHILSCSFPAYCHLSPLDLSVYSHKYRVETDIGNYTWKTLMYQFSSYHLCAVLWTGKQKQDRKLQLLFKYYTNICICIPDSHFSFTQCVPTPLLYWYPASTVLSMIEKC